MKQFKEEFKNGEISALEYFSNSQNQKDVMKEICTFGDEELRKSFLDLFDWVGEKDSYVADTPGNKLYEPYDAIDVFTGRQQEPEKRMQIKKSLRGSDMFTLNELLRFGRFTATKLAPLIGNNDASYREALIYQIKTYSPMIASAALTKVLTAAQRGSETADELANTCITYGTFSPQALQILQELGTAEQKKLYQMHHC